MAKRPNILLIVIDQFRADLLGRGPLGQVAQLPNLRALMDEAVSFTRHYSVVAPCGPSRVSLLTGQYAMNHRAVRNGTPLRHDTPTLGTEMRKAGYVPQLFGYTDTAQDPRVLSPDDPRLSSYEELINGFDEATRMRMETDDSAWRDHLASQGISLPPYPDTYRPAGNDIRDPAIYPADLSDTAFLTDRFLADMGAAAPGWFGLLTYIRPHPPLVAPAPYNDMYDPADMPPAARGDYDSHAYMKPARDKQTPASMVVGFPDLDASEETTAALRALYLGLASEVDHHIGRIIAWLKQSGLWEETILVVTADHGEMLGDYGLWGKGTFHDAAFHVPLIIRDPAHPAQNGKRVEEMTESIDVMPTLLERAGVEPPHSLNGQSLIPELDETGTATKEQTVSEYDFGNPVTPNTWMQSLGLASDQCNLNVLRTERHRLVQFGGALAPILFDMHEDGEARDISGQDAHVPLCLELTQKLLRHRMTKPDSLFARTMIGEGGVKTGMF